MNDERPIEKLLRRYAKKRRDAAGPPVELHPATRRLLHGEIGRQLAGAQRTTSGARQSSDSGSPLGSFQSRWKGWLPRLAWAVPLLGLFAVGWWSLLDRPATQQLALGPVSREEMAANGIQASKDERRAPAALPSPVIEVSSADSSAARGTSPSSVPVLVRSLNSPAPGAANLGVVGKNRDTEQELAFDAARDQRAVSLASVAETKGAPARGGGKEVALADNLGIVSPTAPARARLAEVAQTNGLKLNARYARPFEAAASGAAASLREPSGKSATVARSDSYERDQSLTYSQSFANLAPETLKQKAAKAMVQPPSSPVLASFRVEQTGRQLRVVDSDGSTYVGETDASPEFWGDVGSRKEQSAQLFKSDGKINQLPAATKAVPESQMQNNLYRVAGTNRTLNQPVVFTWSFVELTNAPVVAQSSKISRDLNLDTKKLPSQFPAQLQNSLITGRAQFGTGKEIEINAVPVSP